MLVALVAVILPAAVVAQTDWRSRAARTNQAAQIVKQQSEVAPGTVPDVRGQTLDQARKTLRRLDLVATANELLTCQTQAAPGTIWNQDPPPRSAFPHGGAVRVSIMPSGLAVIPPIAGLTPKEAQGRLEGSRLCLGTTAARPGPGEVGTIIDPTDPSAQTRVPVGTRVNVTITSGGYKPTPSPSPATIALVADRYVIAAGESVRFFVNASLPVAATEMLENQNATNVRYLFEFGDQRSSGWISEHSISHEYGLPGTYRVAATAYIKGKKLASAPIDIRVEDSSPPPFAVRLFITPRTTDAGTRVAFSARTELGPAQAQFIFDFGDGFRNGPTRSDVVEHAYTRPGRYYAVVTAMVGNRQVRSSTEAVDVRGPGTTVGPGGAGPTVDDGDGDPTWLIYLAGAGVAGVLFHSYRKRQLKRRLQLERITLDGEKNPLRDFAAVHERRIIHRHVQISAVPAAWISLARARGALIIEWESKDG